MGTPMAEKSRDKYIRLPTFPRPGEVRGGYIPCSYVGTLQTTSLPTPLLLKKTFSADPN
ncbi:MAG: hypothetical protein O4965_26560 [Trichodesmium sp. St19_bin1]|nr:hypothetical protein [Trichodesmium sp. St19_bin1]